MQGLSGTGSLRLAAAFINRYCPNSKVLISSPTWGMVLELSFSFLLVSLFIHVQNFM